MSVPQHRVQVDLGAGLQDVEGVSWSVSRSLSGFGLPGQVRGVSGSSVGSGALTVGDGRTPWTPQALSSGGSVVIDAALDSHLPLVRVATMVARDLGAPGALALDRDLSIEDDLGGLLSPIPPQSKISETPADLSSVISDLATSLGIPSDVQASGVTSTAILTEGETGWEICQWVARVTLGACWVSETGVLTYRGPAAMRGQGTPRETIHTLAQVVDLPWVESAEDVADRVTLAYTPVNVERVSDQSLTVWESTETLTVAAGATVIVEQDLEVAVDALAPWLPIWSTTAPEAQRSRWAASTQPDGGGERPADSALTVTSALVTASRVRITIKNNSTSTLYVGGGNPTQLLILRANVRASRSAQVTLAAGVEASASRSECSLDLGTGVSSEAEARTLLAWLAAQTASPQATLSQIQVVPDLSRRLGDLVEIIDPITGLSSRCIISGVHLAAEAGSLTQSLDLTLVDGIAPAPPEVIPVVTGNAGTSNPGGISAVEQARQDAIDRNDMSQPSVPSAPTLSARLGVLSISWDGLSNTGGAVSSNLSHVEVALGSATGPTTVIDRIERGGGTVHVTGLPYNSLRYVRLRGVSRNGVASAWSAEGSQQVTPLVNADLIGQVIAEANLGDNVVTARTIIAGAVTTIKLDALAVTADKIAANAITADKILAGQVTGTKIAGDAIDGKTITGAILRTAASGQRVQIDSAGLRAFNSAGTAVTTISASTGVLSATGATITGAINATSGTFSGNINLTGSIKTTSGAFSTTVSAGKITSVGSGWTTTIAGSLDMWAGSSLALRISPYSTGGVVLLSQGNMEIGSSAPIVAITTSYGVALRASGDTAGPYLQAPAVYSRNGTPGTTMRFMVIGDNGTLRAWSSGRAVAPSEFQATRLFSTGILNSPGVYSNTVTSSATVYINSSGNFSRSTSLAAAKVSIEDLVLDGIAVTRALRPRTWHDRGSSERLADALDRKARGEDVDWDEVDVEYPERIPGFIAEEVDALDLPAGFATRDPDGNLSGVAYDRIPAIHTLAIQQLADLVDDLTARLTALEGAS